MGDAAGSEIKLAGLTAACVEIMRGFAGFFAITLPGLAASTLSRAFRGAEDRGSRLPEVPLGLHLPFLWP